MPLKGGSWMKLIGSASCLPPGLRPHPTCSQPLSAGPLPTTPAEHTIKMAAGTMYTFGDDVEENPARQRIPTLTKQKMIDAFEMEMSAKKRFYFFPTN